MPLINQEACHKEKSADFRASTLDPDDQIR
jgi:hypothetical protein